MMKKWVAVGMIPISLFLLTYSLLFSTVEKTLLLDVNQNKLLIDSGIDEAVPVASISKMMTEYLILEEIEKGTVDWNDLVQISGEAAAKEGANISLSKGDNVPVHDLYMAMLLPSANNATVALAEHLADSEKEFVKKMNEKAKEIGLTNSTFVNATGLTESNTKSNQMSARDIAVLAQVLITQFPEVLQDTAKSSHTLTFSGERVHTTNHMLTTPDLAFDGLDGFKTGYTNEAGYCFVGTASRDGQRFITVVLGTENYNARFVETQKLLSLAFDEPYTPPLEASLDR
ncbi:D-alanyl-D-alanine carboxypeptidase family protein [Shouchella hunanensis]|uniref:D-alanyl-D-alanine carboxypeptidase n=1 Tax=Shouchella hunanensis TaxID=766894 RepID=A0ABY7W445_9BACI|nr:D-alanyl-D-alanine carboxypeptidase family protein [Shouchella hunanensis]WDF02233.1 D-alanyl-D-alanine carboxypeptidase [Shouchella hunanensis]